MSPGSAQTGTPLSPEVRELLGRFDSLWHGGQRPRLDDFLAACPEPQRPAALVELIHSDLEFRLRAGEAARVEDYLSRYAELAARPEVVAELLAAEFRLRRRHDPRHDPDEYARRFPEHAAVLERLTPTMPVSDGRPEGRGPEASPPGYEILEELGRGGMGVVYKARQVALNRVVALKMILSGAHASEEELARFQTEAEAVARLQHPGIVAVYEVGQHEGRPYLSMEFCAGGGLDRRLNGTPMVPREAAALVRSLALAVQAAHDAKVVHRDLKPANVLLTDVGGRGSRPLEEGALEAGVGHARPQPKITDFGLARKLDEQSRTQTGHVMGTPSYVPPEQARGETALLGPLVDVYSLGAILYECLTGRPPFRAATVYETLAQVIGDEPVPPRLLNAAVPRELEVVCLKCLEKDASRRYGSARELGEDLGRWLSGEPIAARPVGAATRAARWVRRHKAVSALSAAVLLTLVTGVAVATGFWLEARFQAAEAKKAEGRERQKAEEAEENEKKEKRAREVAEMGRYGFMMTAAWQAWQQNDVATAEAILHKVPPPLQRTWEYLHVRALCQRKAMTLQGEDGVRAVAFSPDGSRIASGGGKVWDARSGQELLTLEGSTGSARAVAYSPDGSRIISDRQGALKVWDARSGQDLLTREGHTWSVTAVAFSPDGSRIASAGSKERTLKVWDAATGRRLLTLAGHADDVEAVAYSPDGSRLASASSDRTVKVWDARSGQDLLTLEGHTEDVNAVAFSPDGSRIVSGSGDATLKVWDARSGQELLTLRGHTGSVTAVAFSPDGSRIVSGSWDKTLEVWDARTGQDLLTLKGHTHSVLTVAFSPDGSRIASGSHDKTVKIWDVRAGQELLTLQGHTNGVDAVAYSPDGSRIVSAGGDIVALDELKVWDARTGRELLTLKGHTNIVRAVAYSPDSSNVVSGSVDRTLKVWDAHTGQDLLTLEGHTDDVIAVAYSPDGERIVSGSEDKTLRVWDAQRGLDVLTLKGHTDVVCAVAFSPDGSRIVSVSGDATLKVWDARSGQELLTLRGHTGSATAVAFSPDGSRVVSVSEDRSLKVWDARTGQDLLSLEGHTEGVNAVAYSPDGSRIVSGSYDKTLKVWDARTGQDLLTLRGHTHPVTAVAFSSDGSRVVSGSDDKTLKVWDARTGRDLLILEGHRKAVRAVAFSPDGKRLASASADGTVKVWDARTGRDLLTLEGYEGSVQAVAFTPDGSRVVYSSKDEIAVGWKVWDAKTGQELETPPWPPTRHDASTVAIHGDRRACAEGNLVRIERLPSWLEQIEDYHANGILRAEREFHEAEADRTRRIDPFTCAFHLDRLLALSPEQRPALLKRRASVLSAALKRDPDDHHSARSLARQAVADFATIDDPKSLLSAIARHQHSSLDCLHGALLLRTGNARDAAVVLRAAVRNRRPDAPPIDELLLALALAKLDRRDEASKHLKAAADWMDNGVAPQRLASVLSARPAGPLAALTALAHVPDLRLNPLDPFTAHELHVLRREVETALGPP